jgi:hypothetical protein
MNCAAIWPRVAPSDCRTAISRWRAASRPRNSEATLAQAISRTKPTAASSVLNVGARLPTIAARKPCASVGASASSRPPNCAL